MDFMKNTYGYNLDKSVKCSNFIGDSIDMAKELGFAEVLLVGHIGKLVKLAGGIMNTHSKIADRRMEILCEAAAINGADKNLELRIMDCVVTEDVLKLLESAGLKEGVMATIMDRCMYYLRDRAGATVNMECIIYSNEQGLLAKSAGADRLLAECMDM